MSMKICPTSLGIGISTHYGRFALFFYWHVIIAQDSCVDGLS